MRNFYHSYQLENVILIDFTQGEKDLEIISDEIANRLLRAFETTSFERMTPSEETVMVEFLGWFNLFKLRGLAINANYPRMSNEADLPVNTAFTYVNCNTGIGLVLVGLFNDGYGDYTFGGSTI